MQGSQESHYEGMIIADPNMILNVTVPETVQKQAENWERGTRTLLHKSFSGSGQPHPDRNFTPEPNVGDGHKTVDQSHCVSTSHTEGKLETELQSHKENVFETQQKKSTAESSQKVRPDDSRECHFQESVNCVQQTNCVGASPRKLQSKRHPIEPFGDHHEQKAYSAKESPPFYAQTHYIKNVTHFQHYFPPTSVQPLFYQDATPHGFQEHTDIKASDCRSINFASTHEWLQYEYLKYDRQPQPTVQHLRVDATSTACNDSGRNELCWRRAGLQAANLFHSCSSAIQRMAQHTSMTTVVARNTQRTVPARKGLRPRCRRWTDSRASASADFAVPHSTAMLRTCCSGHRPGASCQENQDFQQLLSSAWFDRVQPFEHFEDNDVFRPATLSSSRNPSQVSTLDQSGHSSSTEDLMDLSVEETVEYFLKMTSPLGTEFEDHRTDTTTVTPSLQSLHWSFPPSADPF